MILYYSATGNTRHLAKVLGKALSDEVVSIPDSDVLRLSFSGPWLGLMFPIYSWGYPKMLRGFIESLPQSFISSVKRSGAKVWICCSYGDEAGRGADMVRHLLKKRGLETAAVWGVQMPNTYVLLPGFDVDTPEVAKEKIRASRGRLQEVADAVLSGRWETRIHRGNVPGLRSMVYPLFKAMGVDWRKWRSDSRCVGCGECARRCPVANIAMTDGHPQWGTNCESCLACYHYCPTHAVTYGKATQGKGHYNYEEMKKQME